tara:strand:+ start:6373 stop:6978 length:606 start_codon:yes stop_codon:yes gene_type:complete
MGIEEQAGYDAAIISCIIKEYYDDLLNWYGLTISLTEKHVEQVNNEIRNALTHLSRASFMEDADSFNGELSKAKGHFERGKKDCLKLCILELHERLRSTIKGIEIREGALKSEYRKRLVNLEKLRKEAFIKESKNDGTGTIEHLEKIIIDLMELEEQLLEAYPTANPITNWYAIRHRVFHSLGQIALGLIVAGIIWVISNI